MWAFNPEIKIGEQLCIVKVGKLFSYKLGVGRTCLHFWPANMVLIKQLDLHCLLRNVIDIINVFGKIVMVVDVDSESPFLFRTMPVMPLT